MVVYVFLLSRLPTLWRFILAGYFFNALYVLLRCVFTPKTGKEFPKTGVLFLL